MADLHSWNLWHGCRKISEGCASCYMYALDRLHRVSERSSAVAKTSDFGKPLRRDRRGRWKLPAGWTLRVNMTSDTFLEQADAWRPAMWAMIRRRQDLRFYLLTKRPERVEACLPPGWGEGWENVDLNVTCESQRTFDARWSVFSRIPARHKGLNIAPCLGFVDIEPALASGQIESVCLGGEGFGGTRPCRAEWVERTSALCRRWKVNFTFCATGEVFVKDGRTYRLPLQRLQAEQAFLSGLSHFEGPRKFRLFSPLDRHELQDWEIPEPRFSARRCLRCPSLPECPGCAPCRACGEALLPREAMIRQRSAMNGRLQSPPPRAGARRA
ncbi:MAG: phage Gp37/Gp68 family protein [Desulfovibrio sp.]|nr:phage Gp37/Gp68 family protein [Desulfovibrio sp.]